MFHSASAFNKNINAWDTSLVTTMGSMFRSESASAFNKNINAWNTGRVTTMAYMFYFASAFNQNINAWDVRRVITMVRMFDGADVFNGNMGSWDMSSVALMSGMLPTAAFKQDISAWDVSGAADVTSYDQVGVANSNLCNRAFAQARWPLKNDRFALSPGAATANDLLRQTCPLGPHYFRLVLADWFFGIAADVCGVQDQHGGGPGDWNMSAVTEDALVAALQTPQLREGTTTCEKARLVGEWGASGRNTNTAFIRAALNVPAWRAAAVCIDNNNLRHQSTYDQVAGAA